MKECLKCSKDISAKHKSAKFCSTSCRVLWNRNPENKKEKGLTGLQQMTALYNALMDKIDSLALLTVPVPMVNQKTTFDGITSPFSENTKISLKKTPAHWVKLRRECENAEQYAQWLEDLENDIHLTAREKSQIKQTV